MSRLTGLLRVMAFGYVLGKSSLTDAYNQANASPNLIYELALGGVLSATLVPLITRLHHQRDEECQVAVRSVAIVVLAAPTVIAVAAAPPVFRLYTSGISADLVYSLYLESEAGHLFAHRSIPLVSTKIQPPTHDSLGARSNYSTDAQPGRVSLAPAIIATLIDTRRL